jgi:hypothetical protein
MSNTLKGFYQVKNPAKYTGKTQPYYRSSWEYTVMRFFDDNPNIVSWASEPIRIRYFNPILNKYTVYVPDFLVVYEDKHKKQIAEIVEIKPKKETYLSEAKSARSKIKLAINAAKWQAAQAYCKANGLKFRVITESDIWHNS